MFIKAVVMSPFSFLISNLSFLIFVNMARDFSTLVIFLSNQFGFVDVFLCWFLVNLIGFFGFDLCFYSSFLKWKLRSLILDLYSFPFNAINVPPIIQVFYVFPDLTTSVYLIHKCVCLSPYPSYEHHYCILICLIGILTWIIQRHLKFNTCRN